MVFYMNTGGIDTIEEIAPDENKAYLLVSEIKYLNNFDIKEFNYYMFEEDIDNMSAGEFEWWFKETFIDWLNVVEDQYLDIDYDSIKNYFQRPEEKKLFLKKIVNFIMFFFPYQILRNVIRNLEMQSIEELIEYSRDLTNLIELRKEIVSVIEDSMLQTDEFVNALANFEKISKKNLLDTNVELLDEHIKKQNFFLNIFKELILNTDMEKVLDLLTKYAEMDAKNII